jgi:hypothetical protein
MKLSYNHQGNEAFEFENLNQKLEKVVTEEEPIPEKPKVVVPVEKTPTVDTIIKKNFKIDPEKMLKSLSTQVEKEEQEKAKKKSKERSESVLKALKALEVKEEIEKKTKIIDKLLKDEENE